MTTNKKSGKQKEMRSGMGVGVIIVREYWRDIGRGKAMREETMVKKDEELKWEKMKERKERCRKRNREEKN